MINFVDELAVAEKRIFVRVDFNVPLDSEGKITDQTRIEESLPTLRYLIEQKARLIVASHLGRPHGKVDKRYSLLPVAKCLSGLLATEVIFPENCIGDAVRRLAKELKTGSVMLLENLRFHPGEEENDPEFAEQLASLADVYVSDAFGTMHRAHASTSGMVAHFEEKGAGFLVQKELKALARLVQNPERPFWAVIGGAKVSDKIGLIEKLIDKVDGLVLGGGLAYTFLKAQGHEIGRSRLEEEKLFLAGRILQRARTRDVPIVLPIDHRVAKDISSDAAAVVTDSVEIPSEMIGLDIGPKTVSVCLKALREARTIFWNGPLGYFEITAFAEGTRQVAEAIAKSEATSVIGGGDSLSALKALGLEKSVTHISTGGGASLTYLEGRELPGLKALEEEIAA